MNEVHPELQRVARQRAADVRSNLVFLLIASHGKNVMGVANWLSPNVSKPETVRTVELKGNASAKPRFELRVCVR